MFFVSLIKTIEGHDDGEDGDDDKNHDDWQHLIFFSSSLILCLNSLECFNDHDHDDNNLIFFSSSLILCLNSLDSCTAGPTCNCHDMMLMMQ